MRLAPLGRAAQARWLPRTVVVMHRRCWATSKDAAEPVVVPSTDDTAVTDNPSIAQRVRTFAELGA